jgi:FixJ family two-component response regulator
MTAKVYIIDDDDGLRESLRALLECYDFAVEDHASGTTFLDTYRDDGKGCLVLDLHMPKPDGLDVLARLRGPLKSRLPVVLVTGRGDKELRERVLAAGADCYIEKPVDVDQLVSTIHGLLAKAPVA